METESPTLQPGNSRKRELLRHFETNGDELNRPGRFNSAYRQGDLKFMQFLIPPGKLVLELGCGRGDLLAALKPSRGVGIDFSADMIAKAQSRISRSGFCRWVMSKIRPH